ncbi:MAG: TraX family protein [Paraclostridium sp.]|uniref:TraX family protein n=1 Tax=Paraclostridium sp. TaxID=2023273 RepID=UPI003F39D8AF
MKKINAFELKVFALIVMLFDHLREFFPHVFPMWVHPVSRVVSPIFAFLVVEGLFHTRNKLKYNLRLIGWAVFMQVGDTLINMALKSKEVVVNNNIFLTLALGLTIINLIEYSKQKHFAKKLIILLAAIILIPLAPFTEGGMAVIPFILVTYFFRGNNKKLVIGYIILSVISFLLFTYLPYPSMKEAMLMLPLNCDFLFILAVPLILLYNGERGLNNKFSKYLFYVFYPLHLWGLAILKYVLK